MTRWNGAVLVYTDLVHLSAKGNEEIAGCLFEGLVPLIKGMRAGRSGDFRT